MYLSSSARFAKERGFFQFARVPAILSIFVSLMKSSHWWVEEVLNECHCVTQLQPKFSRDAENEGIAELLVGFISIHDLPSPPVEFNGVSPCKGGDVQTVRISFRRRSSISGSLSQWGVPIKSTSVFSTLMLLDTKKI